MKNFITIGIAALFALPVNATQYYCPSSSGSGYDISDIYNTEDDCKAWNSDFWKKNSPNAYSDCISKQEILKTRYKEGKCTLIQKKKHIIDGCECNVEISPKYNIVHSYGCSGGNSCTSTDSAIEKLKKMYK